MSTISADTISRDRELCGVAWFVLLSAVAGVAVPALGQNALGDGTGLQRPMERDLGRGVPSGRANTAAAFQQEMTFRNAIVTGNAPGGASFRGDVGYLAPNEFRGTLGSNDLFAFRRDSLYSGFAGLGIRGTDALQYQFALATGNASGLLGVGSVSRSGGGIGLQVPSTLADPSLLQEVGQARDPNRPEATQPRTEDQDPLGGSLMGMLRSPSSYIVNRSIQPELLSAFADPSTGQDWGFTASSLRGVRMSRLLDSAQLAAARERMGVGTASNVVQTPTATTAVETARPTTNLPSTSIPGSFQFMMDRFRETASGRTPEPVVPNPDVEGDPPAPGTPPSLPGVTVVPGSEEWERRLTEMRDRLTADLTPTLTRERPSVSNAPDPSDERLADNTSPGSLQFRPLDAQTLRIIRESSATMRSYVPAGAPADAYAEHMSSAGTMMQQGRYFDAEERFVRAQAARPDDYIARVGRLHAQIGAFLFVSAGRNLRELLSQHPEVAATRFEGTMLPSAARLSDAVARLRQNAAEALSGRMVSLGAESALLIAYVGYQRQDEALMLEGFDLYRRLIEPAGEGAPRAGGEHGRALLELIIQVWGGAPQGVP